MNHHEGISNYPGFILEAQRDLEQMRDLKIRLEADLSVSEVLALIGTIQLACRHPEFTGPSRAISENFARNLEEFLTEYTTPAIAWMAALGWDPRFDLEGDSVGQKRS